MKNFYIIIAIGAVAISGLILWQIPNRSVGQLDEFAKYLAEKGITMYGAEWCAHCQSEKRNFGDSFRFVPYVECPDNPKVCLAADIRAYPTWVFPNGKKLVGEQGIEKLAKESGYQITEQ